MASKLTLLLQVVAGLSWTTLPANGVFDTVPAEVGDVLSACSGDIISIRCGHTNTGGGVTRWIFSPPVDCSEIIEHSRSNDRQCGSSPFSFQDITQLAANVVLNSTAVATANATMTGTTVQCLDSAGISPVIVGMVTLCIFDRPTGITVTNTTNGVMITWALNTNSQCMVFANFTVTISIRENDISNNDTMWIKRVVDTRVEFDNLLAGQEYTAAVSTVLGSCSTDPAITSFTFIADNSPSENETKKSFPSWAIVLIVIIPLLIILFIVALVIVMFVKSSKGPLKKQDMSIPPPAKADATIKLQAQPLNQITSHEYGEYSGDKTGSLASVSKDENELESNLNGDFRGSTNGKSSLTSGALQQPPAKRGLAWEHNSSVVDPPTKVQASQDPLNLSKHHNPSRGRRGSTSKDNAVASFKVSKPGRPSIEDLASQAPTTESITQYSYGKGHPPGSATMPEDPKAPSLNEPIGHRPPGSSLHSSTSKPRVAASQSRSIEAIKQYSYSEHTPGSATVPKVAASQRRSIETEKQYPYKRHTPGSTTVPKDPKAPSLNEPRGHHPPGSSLHSSTSKPKGESVPPIPPKDHHNTGSRGNSGPTSEFELNKVTESTFSNISPVIGSSAPRHQTNGSGFASDTVTSSAGCVQKIASRFEGGSVTCTAPQENYDQNTGSLDKRGPTPEFSTPVDPSPPLHSTLNTPNMSAANTEIRAGDDLN